MQYGTVCSNKLSALAGLFCCPTPSRSMSFRSAVDLLTKPETVVNFAGCQPNMTFDSAPTASANLATVKWGGITEQSISDNQYKSNALSL